MATLDVEILQQYHYQGQMKHLVKLVMMMIDVMKKMFSTLMVKQLQKFKKMWKVVVNVMNYVSLQACVTFGVMIFNIRSVG